MVVVSCSVLAVIAVHAGYLFARKRRRARRGPHDVLRQVFRPREYRELDGRLERIAELELRRLEATAKRYIAGDAGYVVGISGSRHGIGLGLSDGHRLLLGGVSRSMLSLLVRDAAAERLRPAHVSRDAFSYRLLLRGEAGAETEVFARTLTLAL
jgi:hypothetical protein